MDETYAVIYMTFHLIAALAIVGLACYFGGKIRARILWNLEDEVCDKFDARTYDAYQKMRESIFPKMMKGEVFSKVMNGEVFFSKFIRDEVIFTDTKSGFKQIKRERNFACKPTEGTWVCPINHIA